MSGDKQALSWGDLSFGSGELGSKIATDTDNPWLTLGIMNAIESEELLQEWDEVLAIQTRLLGGGEVAWLQSKGFGAGGRGVLEVGSANGNFGSFLARSFPETQVHGLEANKHFVARFQRTAGRPPNYDVATCKVGEDPMPASVHGSFDQCILRFVLQHVSDPGRVLRAIYDALPPGGRLFIIEEDDHFFTLTPDWKPFATAADMWRRVCAAGGTDSKIGRKLPQIVASAGFEVSSYDIVLRNNVEMGDGFLDYFTKVSSLLHRTNPNLVDEAEYLTVAEGFQASMGDHAHRYVATYPQFLLAASKPGGAS